jgi:hypothetical protein
MTERSAVVRRLPAWAFLVAVVLASVVVPGAAGPAFADAEFRRGDANADGRLSLSDALMIRRWIFNGDRPPTCEDSADFDDDSLINITDQIRLITYLFLDGDPPPPPYLGMGTDPTPDDITCEAYDVVEPLETSDLVDIGDVEALPGADVMIPVHITNSEEVEAFQIVVEYDPSVFTPKNISFDGTFYEGIEELIWYKAARPSSIAGVFTASFIPHLTETGFELPPSEGVIAFMITGTVSPDAPAGEIVLNPTNGPDGAGVGPEGLRNELTHRGDARYFSVVPETLPGLLAIVPDLAIFRRGDSNGDQAVNISDPQFTLNYLFNGAETVTCMDAADANDDGKVDMSDPIATLQFLFVGRASLPAPSETPGSDPTADGLDCE